MSSAITLYDPAAAFQPTAGSNSYTPANPAFPPATNPDNPGYNPNPPTLNVNLDNTTVFNVDDEQHDAALADKGLIAANYSNDENPAVNNVILNNAGSFEPHHFADRDEPHGGDRRRQSGEQFYRP